jgi:hypothetical protein
MLKETRTMDRSPPQPKKTVEMEMITPPNKELETPPLNRFVGMFNFYHDLWLSW